jgi:hypothetical protein
MAAPTFRNDINNASVSSLPPPRKILFGIHEFGDKEKSRMFKLIAHCSSFLSYTENFCQFHMWYLVEYQN